MTAIRVKQDEASMEINMTPMIDVIFQLIIFFMCSIHFKSLEGKLYSYLPYDKGLHGPPPPLIEEVRISLIYNANLAPLMTQIKIGTEVMPDWDALANRITILYQTIYRPQELSGQEPTPFKIDAQAQIPAQAVINTLNICKKAGVGRVEFAAKSPPARGPTK